MTDYVAMSREHLAQARAAELRWRALDWIADNYKDATPDERAMLDEHRERRAPSVPRERWWVA